MNEWAGGDIMWWQCCKPCRLPTKLPLLMRVDLPADRGQPPTFTIPLGSVRFRALRVVDAAGEGLVVRSTSSGGSSRLTWAGKAASALRAACSLPAEVATGRRPAAY